MAEQHGIIMNTQCPFLTTVFFPNSGLGFAGKKASLLLACTKKADLYCRGSQNESEQFFFINIFRDVINNVDIWYLPADHSLPCWPSNLESRIVKSKCQSSNSPTTMCQVASCFFFSMCQVVVVFFLCCCGGGWKYFWLICFQCCLPQTRVCTCESWTGEKSEEKSTIYAQFSFILVVALIAFILVIAFWLTHNCSQ